MRALYVPMLLPNDAIPVANAFLVLKVCDTTVTPGRKRHPKPTPVITPRDSKNCQYSRQIFVMDGPNTPRNEPTTSDRTYPESQIGLTKSPTRKRRIACMDPIHDMIDGEENGSLEE